jgi:hypothetical protein
MKRLLFGEQIRQQSKSGYFSANDLINAGNKFRVSNNMKIIKLQDWLMSSPVREFVSVLESEISQKAKNATRGRNATTWIHPFLFIKLALHISPKLEVSVYKWLYDELLKYRNDSGDSYKKMTGSLWLNCSNKSKFSKGIVTTANMIKDACKVKDWQQATEEQLSLRDKIHDNIALLADVLKDNNQAIRIGIEKALDETNKS